MRKRDWVALSFLLTGAATAFWHGQASSSGSTAQRAASFIDSMGVNTHITFTSTPYNTVSNITTDMAYLGITGIRDWILNSALSNQTNYATLAAAGIRFNFVMAGANIVNECSTSASSLFAPEMTLLDNFVTTYPGSIVSVEGLNEVNNFPQCFFETLTTNAITSTGSGPLPGANSTLHFASVPLSLQALPRSNVNFVAPAGGVVTITDSSAPGPIDQGFCYNGGASTVTQSCGTLTINNANELLVAEMTENGGPVTGCADTLSLTWIKRGAVTWASGAAEEWYAIGPSGGSYPQTDTVTCTQTTSTTYFSLGVFGIPGANLSTPFDGTIVTGATDPLSITTSHANTIVLGNFVGDSACPAPGNGYASLVIGCTGSQTVEYQGFSSTQSGLAVGTANGAQIFANIADAVVMLAPPALPALSSTTEIWAATSTSFILSQNVIGGGVGSGDTITIATGQANDAQTQAAAIAWNGLLYQTIKADSKLAGVKIFNWTNLPENGVLGTYDYFNSHPYPAAGVQPFQYIQSEIGFTPTTNFGLGIGSAFAITEDGYVEPADGGGAVDLVTQGIYTLNIYLDSFYNHDPATYIYELMDETSSACTVNCGGLFAVTTPKAAATDIHNLTTILNDSGGTARTFTPGSLNYTVSNLPPPVAYAYPTQNTINNGGWSFLLQKSNGTFEVVVWNEPQIWNASGMSEVTPTPISSTVNIGMTCGTINVYDPITDTSPIATHSSASSVTLSLGADPQIVECIP